MKRMIFIALMALSTLSFSAGNDDEDIAVFARDEVILPIEIGGGIIALSAGVAVTVIGLGVVGIFPEAIYPLVVETMVEVGTTSAYTAMLGGAILASGLAIGAFESIKELF